MKGKRIRMSLRFAYGLRRLFVHWALLVFLGLGAPALAQDVHILAFGDSLTAGHGLPRGQGFAPQLEQALRRNGIRTFVTDAGVSGDTTAAGRARLQWTLDGLEEKPDLAIVALGGNDMLRGLPPRQTRANMEAIVAELDRHGIKVLIAGMITAHQPRPEYGTPFNPLFPPTPGQFWADPHPLHNAKKAGGEK